MRKVVITFLILISFLTTLFSGSFGTESSEPKVSWSGEINLENRYFENIDNKFTKNLTADLDLKYTGDNSEGFLNFNYINEDNEFLLDEGYVRVFFDKFDLLVGKKKVVWGKGDKLHVIDNINPTDYSDFINEDYLDRKIAQNMIKIDYYSNIGNFEIVYLPKFKNDKLPKEGLWVQKETKMMKGSEDDVTEYGLNLLDKDRLSYSELSELKDKLKNETDYPDYNKLKDGNIAVRYTKSIRGFDIGFSYYNGRLKIPSYNKKSLFKIDTAL